MLIFKPKWKSKDSKVRLNWIRGANPEKNKHSNILADMAYNDSNEQVCLAAIERLLDVSALMRIVDSEQTLAICQAAANRLVDLAESRPELLLDKWDEVSILLNSHKHADYEEKEYHVDHSNRSYDCIDLGYFGGGHVDRGFPINFPEKPLKL